MTPAVELFSATDPVYVPNRRVWYWTEFNGLRSERLEDYEAVLVRALVIRQEHDTCLVDRSDKGSGFLLRTIR